MHKRTIIPILFCLFGIIFITVDILILVGAPLFGIANNAYVGWSSSIPIRMRHILLIALLSVIWCVGVVKYTKGDVVGQATNLRRYSYLLSNLVRKDFTTKYRRSVLGVLWSVLNPLLMMVVISLVFSQMFRQSIEHFPVYFMTGSFIFSLMSEATNGSLVSIQGASGLIKKVYVPKYLFPVEKCVFSFINHIFSFVAMLILMPVLGVPLTAPLLLAWVPALYTLVFSIGLGLILASLQVFFRDVGHLYSVLITAWMYLTPIFYPISALPENVRGIVAWNPVYHFATYFRWLSIDSAIPGLRANMVCMSFALSFLFVGLLIFKKLQDKFILYI